MPELPKINGITSIFDVVTGKIARYAGYTGTDKIVYSAETASQWLGSLQSIIADLVGKRMFATAIKVLLSAVYGAVFIWKKDLNPRMRVELYTMSNRLQTAVARDLLDMETGQNLANNLATMGRALRTKNWSLLKDSLVVDLGEVNNFLSAWSSALGMGGGVGGGGSNVTQVETGSSGAGSSGTTSTSTM